MNTQAEPGRDFPGALQDKALGNGGLLGESRSSNLAEVKRL